MFCPDWCTTFGLSEADKNRLVLSVRDTYGKPYGKEMSKGFEAAANGYLLSQEKPVGVFIVREDEVHAEQEIAEGAWETYWNQGLASVLILHLPQKVKVYSLLARNPDVNRPIPAIVAEINTILERFGAIELLRSIEEGTLFRDNLQLFPKNNRVDQHLLGNLLIARKNLIAQGLSKEGAQNLLLQILFIAYLEDRGILPESDFSIATNGEYACLEQLLLRGDTGALAVLFSNLSGQFNGDVFAAPCNFSGCCESAVLTSKALQVLSGLRKGDIDAHGQYQLFRRYDFKYIPIPLLSAIYDRFQDELIDMSEPESLDPPEKASKRSKQRETGSYFTPAHLAQVCISFAWQHVPADTARNNDFHVLDPACGSAVFLVCAFQRIVGLKLASDDTLDWRYLTSLLVRLHGCDRQSSAIHVGIVSLYIALLEYMEPPALLELRRRGKLLPQLFNISMLAVNYFQYNPSVKRGYDLIVGNPPWISRQGERVDTASLDWCRQHGYAKSIPNNSPTWAFVWKCGEELAENGVAALLINAAHVFGINTRGVMRHLFQKYSVPSIYSFADACFQLFDGAAAPAALCVFRKRSDIRDLLTEKTCFWSLKANPDYYVDQRIVATRSDLTRFSQQLLAQDPAVLTTAKWARPRDIALLNDLKLIFPSLGERVVEYQSDQRLLSGKWLIGQGINPGTRKQKPIGFDDFPFCDASVKNFRWVLPQSSLTRYPSTDTFDWLRMVAPVVEGRLRPPFVLVKQGVSRETGQLQASYTESAITFSTSIQVIAASDGSNNAEIFKILTAVLNSRFAAWYFLHMGSVSGVERDKIPQQELMSLPFPGMEESPNPESGKRIVALIDEIARLRSLETKRDANAGLLRAFTPDFSNIESEINECVYSYYGLLQSERELIEDSFRYILPSLQPRRPDLPRSKSPPLWKIPNEEMLKRYAQHLQISLSANYTKDNAISVTVYCHPLSSLLIAVAERGSRSSCEVVVSEQTLREQLDKTMSVHPDVFAGGVQNLPQLAFAEGNRLFIIKPNRTRYWMPSEGLADADRVIADFRRQLLGRTQ